MTRLIIPALIAVLVCGPAWGMDKGGTFVPIGSPPCGEYLDAYSRSKLSGDSTYEGPYEMWNATGFISRYLSAYNMLVKNGKADIKGSMSSNDVRRWLASWCRDNPSSLLMEGLSVLTTKLDR